MYDEGGREGRGEGGERGGRGGEGGNMHLITLMLSAIHFKVPCTYFELCMHNYVLHNPIKLTEE